MAQTAEKSAPSDPDGPLVEATLRGDRQAFDQLVVRYQRPLFHLALRYVKRSADAEDVTQRALVRAYEKLGSFRGSSSFKTWLYRITINLALNHLRDHRREEPSEIHEGAVTQDAVGAKGLISDQEASTLRDAIEELPPKQRLCLELRIFDELSFRDVAELAGCSENAAKVNFHYAVKKLRELIEERGQS